MKLDGYEILHCDAGWRKFSFLRLHADDGTAVAEYNESYGGPGLSAVIEGQLEWIMGANPWQPNGSPPSFTRGLGGAWALPNRRAPPSRMLYRYERTQARSAVLRTARWHGARPNAALLVPLRKLPTTQYRAFSRRRTHSKPRRYRRYGKRGPRQRFSALKTNIFLFDDEHAHAHAWIRANGGMARAQSKP